MYVRVELIRVPALFLINAGGVLVVYDIGGTALVDGGLDEDGFDTVYVAQSRINTTAGDVKDERIVGEPFCF